MASHLQSRGWRAWVALPAVPVYWLASSAHRALYRLGIKKRIKVSAPVIVVGNITVGGTGKSPLARAIVDELVVRGYKPGIALRGYGGQSEKYPVHVLPSSDPREVGDEAVEHAELSGRPVVVDPVRASAAEELVERHDCNVIVLDDGLQHHGIARDIEIAVVDGERGFGNGWLLPAGPLRENEQRLASVDHVVVNGGTAIKVDHASTFKMRVRLSGVSNLANPSDIESVDVLKDRKLVAMTAVGNPERVSGALEAAGLTAKRRDFPDHYQFGLDDIDIEDDEELVVTGKDAVKFAAVLDGHALKSRVWRNRVSV